MCLIGRSWFDKPKSFAYSSLGGWTRNKDKNEGIAHSWCLTLSVKALNTTEFLLPKSITWERKAVRDKHWAQSWWWHLLGLSKHQSQLLKTQQPLSPLNDQTVTNINVFIFAWKWRATIHSPSQPYLKLPQTFTNTVWHFNYNQTLTW